MMSVTPEWARALALGPQTADQLAERDVTSVLIGQDASEIRDRRIAAINEVLVGACPQHSATELTDAAYLYGLAMGRRCKGGPWFEKLLAGGQSSIGGAR